MRQGLIGKGISNDDIGYDQNTGFVQVKGQNFLKPEMNVQGTTYTSQPNFDTAYRQYQTGQRQQQQQQLTDQMVQKVNAPPAANPYADQYTKMIADIQARMAAPQQDVYSTPQYAAAQAQQQRATDRNNRQTQEAYGETGFGRSTNMGERIQRNQNDANEYLSTQLVPQIQSQLAAQRQAEIANQASLLNPVMGLMNRQDTQDQNHLANVKSVLDMLGTQGQNDINNQRNQINDERQAQQDHINLANELSRIYGITVDPKNDPALAYEQVKGLQPLAAQSQGFNQQMEKDKFNYAKGQDAIQQTAQYAGMYNGQPTMQKIMQNATIQNMTADNLRAAAAEARSVGKDDIALKMDIWEKTGQAPAGIPGVTAGSSLAGKTKTPLSVQDAQSILLKTPFITDETTTDRSGVIHKTGKTKIDKPGLVQAIAGLGMTDDQMDALFNLNGISEDEVKAIAKKLDDERKARGN